MEEHAFILTSVLALQDGQEQGVKLVSDLLGLLLEVLWRHLQCVI